jgi:5-methyltetrahydrofolate--homocysteine methyltransferase
MSDILAQISTAVIEGKLEGMEQLTQQALDGGLDAQQILNDGLMKGMDHVGVEFKAGNMFVPEVLRSARAMQSSMNILRPILAESGVEMVGRILLGTVKGDLHDIGKNLVGIVLKGAGFEIVDLGYDVAPEHFVRTATERGASVIGMSALLTTTMPQMATVVELLRQQDRGATIKTIVGGAPVSEAFARQIGADAYGFDAVNAVERVMSLVDAAGTGERAAATPKKG